MAAMDSFLITVDGSEHEVSTGTVQHLLDTSARFWLDLAGLDKQYTAESPDESWETYYARQILRHFRPSNS